MSAQAIFTPGAPSDGASRAIARVSPNGGGVAISPALPDDIGNLFLWINDAQAAQSDMPYRPVDCLMFKDWLDQQTKQSAQVLFVIRTLQPARAVGFVLFKNSVRFSAPPKSAFASAMKTIAARGMPARLSSWRCNMPGTHSISGASGSLSSLATAAPSRPIAGQGLSRKA